jgi:hypothetical protein
MSNLAERVQRVRLLLETLNDPYPTPRGALEPDAGPSASRYVPCETCREQGWVRRRQRRYVLCLACDGVGWRRRERDDVEWDAYLELPLDEAAELPREPTRRTLPPPGDGEPPYAWERMQRTYERHGSYRQLRVQLERLSYRQPRRYRLVRAVLVDHEPRLLDEVAALELELGVVTIALGMRGVRVPGWLIERSAAAERRSTVGELAAQGLRAGEIARILGMTKEAVRRKLATAERRRIQRAGAPARAA